MSTETDGIVVKMESECTIPMGAPCLNYLAFQIENVGKNRIINLLAVYRNHDFLTRAYGNYFGLGILIAFVSKETNSTVGTLTCISSHAYYSKNKRLLKKYLGEIEKYEKSIKRT